MKKPRKYQKEAIEAVVNGLKRDKRGQLILPCGAGKTLVSLWIAQKMGSSKTLVLVPSLSLLKQIKDEWVSQGDDVSRLCICSEKDIDSFDSILIKEKDIDGNVTTDPDVIKKFIESNSKFVIYSTYHSLENLSIALLESGQRLDLAICDEAHRTAGNKDKITCFSFIHSDLVIPVDYRLYMTATPRVYVSRDDTNALFCMNNTEIYGKQLYTMTFGQAIEKKILIDYKIIAIAVSCEEVYKRLFEANLDHNSHNIVKLSNNFALEKFMDEYKASHIVTYHSSIKRAKEFRDDHKGISVTPIYHVNGKQTAKIRAQALENFANDEKAIITNSRCLTEGIDVPAIDAVYFCDPKNSKIDILQAVGRALRRDDKKGKKTGYIVIPLFHSPQSDLDKQIKNSSFANLVSVVRAITTEDSTAYETIKSLTGKRKGDKFLINSEKFMIHASDIGVTASMDLKESLYMDVVQRFNTYTYMAFKKLKTLVKNKGIKTQREYKSAKKNGDFDEDIPWAPDVVYKHAGWKGWGDFLGTGRVLFKNFYTYEEATEAAKTLNIKSKKDYERYVADCNERGSISRLPSTPHKTYADKWIDWPNFLGRPGNKKPKVLRLTFEECRAFVKTFNFSSKIPYHKMKAEKTLPINIPWKPEQIYKSEWRGWPHYLGREEQG